MRLDGVDVSDARGVIDWAAVATTAPPLGFVMARQTHGGHGDTNLRVDKQAAANKAGMRQHFPNTPHGFYHFLGTSTPAVQARHFAAVTGRLLPGEFVMLDVEPDPPAQVPVLSTTQIVTTLEAIEQEFQLTPFLYIGRFYSGSLDSRLWRFPLVLPAYTSEAAYKTLAAQMGRPVVVWQWGGGTNGATVPGISGRVDSNRIENQAAFRAALKQSPAPRPPDVVVPAPIPIVEDEDMADYFSHEDADDQGHPKGWTWWRLMPDGTKRHVTGLELDRIARYPRDDGPFLTMAEIDTIPDYVAASSPGVAVGDFSIKLTGSATPTGL